MTPLPLLTYRVASLGLLPFAARRRIAKLRQAGVPVPRAHETLGHASVHRPLGPLIWLHAASVGEAKSALVLIEALQEMRADLRFLVTSGTATSAEVMATRLPESAIHQFSPLDGTGPVRRFLRHWRPYLGLFVESEIWPNLIEEAARANIPLGLVNARLSDRSFGGWRRVPETARRLFGRFGLIHCQNRRSAAALAKLGLRHARKGVNLKSIVAPPQVDEVALQGLRAAFGERPIWAAVSTHPGEEEMMLDAHDRLRQTHPNAALVLVPRHPERASEIRRLIGNRKVAQRSRQQKPDPHTEVYLADTMGETDLWFTLAASVCLCGSFSDVGGHTPYEPAAAGAPLLHGPHYANHIDAYMAFLKAGASLQVENAGDLAAELARLVAHPEEARALADAARPLAAAGREDLERLAQQCLALGGLTPRSDNA